MDEESCVKDGGVRIQVGRSAGRVFYDQSDHPASQSTPLSIGYSTSVPVSSPRSGPDLEATILDGMGCPLTIVAFPGQRIRLRVIVVSSTDDPVMDSESYSVVGDPDTCPETLIVRDSALASTVRLPICSSRRRDSQIYLSIGHRLSVRLEQSGDGKQRRGNAGPTPTSHTRPRRSGFLLTYDCQ